MYSGPITLPACGHQSKRFTYDNNRKTYVTEYPVGGGGGDGSEGESDNTGTVSMCWEASDKKVKVLQCKTSWPYYFSERKLFSISLCSSFFLN